MKNLLFTLMSSLILTGISFAKSVPSATTEDEIDTYYYENSTIVFAEGVDMVKYAAVNPKESFVLKDATVKVTAVVKLDKPFKTKSIIVDIYDENDDMYDSFDIEIQEDWDFFSFNMDFDQKGHFYIDIYTDNDVFINDAEVDIE
jgi:hypothetical protein